MDQNLIVPSKIKEKLEACVIRTNGVITRWMTVNGVDPKKITSDDVRTIFLGYVRKELFSNKEWRDYRRLSKITNVCISDHNKLITQVIYGSLDILYYHSKGYIEALAKQIDSVNYLELQSYAAPVSSSELSSEIYIDFNTIKNITF